MNKKLNKVNNLMGCNTFEELEQEFENYIYYADGCEQSVLDNIDVEDEKYIKLYLFDGWVIALWN
ncbi:hypothetical protein [Staphylococcus phage vB_SsapH-Golestan-105-M]|nr:hypothetical protein [Staphylococcus phage vB_SsapH-Golestan-105-M]